MTRPFFLDGLMKAQEAALKEPLGFWPCQTRVETCEFCDDEFHPSAENQRTDSAGHFSHWQCDNCIEKQQMYGREW